MLNYNRSIFLDLSYLDNSIRRRWMVLVMGFLKYSWIVAIPILFISIYYFQTVFINYIKVTYPDVWSKILPADVLPSLRWFPGGKKLFSLKGITYYVNKNYLSSLNDAKLANHYRRIRVAEMIAAIYAILFFTIGISVFLAGFIISR